MRVPRPQSEKISKQALTEGLLYFLVWTSIFLIPILSGSIFSRDPFNWNRIAIAWSVILPYFALFMIHNFVLMRRLLLGKRYLSYALSTIGVTVIIFSAVALYQDLNDIDINQPDLLSNGWIFSYLPLHVNLLLGVFMCGLNVGIMMIFKSIRDDQVLAEMKHNIKEAKLVYLKYQINPHFFMNTLNNIHALIDIDSEAAKDTVIELSKMMRYVLYDSEQDSISLEKEIHFLQHYIQLMRLRYSDSVEIVVDVPEESPSQVKIPPLIFIVFVENAFKHGISYNSRSFIHISIEVSKEADRVRYCVTNTKNPSKWNTQGGIGLDNVRKRLDLLFPKRYQLEIENTSNQYSVELNIPVL